MELTDWINEKLSDLADLDYTDFFEDQLTALEELHQTYFETETDPDGNAWKPLAPSTIAKKGHDRILIETGALNNSLVLRNAEGAVREVTEDSIRFGTDIEYSQYHQQGARRRQRRTATGRFASGFIFGLPQRKHVGLTDEFWDNFIDDLNQYIVDNWEG
jgi:phage gpG-like protein